MKMPILHEGEVMVHANTRTIGVVVDTIYPPDNKREKFEQVLRLTDGTRRQFRLVELTPASPAAVEQFWEEAKSTA
jgi:hypothetical protein